MLTSNTCIPIQTEEISFPARGTQTELSVTPGGCCLTICVRLCTRRDSGHQLLFFWGSIISPVPASTLAVLNDYVAECGTSEMKACPQIQWWLQSRLLSWMATNRWVNDRIRQLNQCDKPRTSSLCHVCTWDINQLTQTHPGPWV